MAPRKSVTTRTKAKTGKASQEASVDTYQATSQKPQREIPGFLKSRRNIAIVVAAVVVVAALVFFLQSFLVAARVNGQPISRLELISNLEKQYGRQTLDSLITKTLILQEGEKQHITVSQDEVNREIKKIEESVSKQGQTLDALLQAQGLTRKSLEEQIRIQKTIDKMLGKDIKISQKEIDDYVSKNQSSFPKDMKQEEIKKTVAEQLRQTKLSEKFQKWLADVQKNAKIDYVVHY